MPRTPEDKPYTPGPAIPGGEPWEFRAWSTEEWDLIPPGRTPPGASRVGTMRAEVLLAARTDSGEPAEPSRLSRVRGTQP